MMTLCYFSNITVGGFCSNTSFVPFLTHCSSDEGILQDACWAVSYITDGNNDQLQAAVESGMVPKLVEHLDHSVPAIQDACLRALGNIVSGDDVLTGIVLLCNILQKMPQLLEDKKMDRVKEACWALSNITGLLTF
jgi:hypothetical protein